MKNVVIYHRDIDVAVITVDNPPDQGLDQAVRSGLIEALRQAEADSAVGAVVLLGAGRGFLAGAAASEFELSPSSPDLPELTQAVEAATKPVVAALHGDVLGGACEIALATHYRIATATARFGFPAVKLGGIPGAGGTQRLPRLVGAEQALKMIAGGDAITAEQALAIGAIDAIAAGELGGAAIAAARRLIGTAPRRTGAITMTAPDPAVFAEAERATAKRQRHLLAPRYGIDAIRAATTLPFEQGLQRERELCLELRGSPQAAALRHAAAGLREVAKIPGLPADTPTRAVERVAVIGAGTMGGGIAMCFANAGFTVLLLEAEAAALERGMAAIRRNYANSVARGSLDEAAMEQRLARLQPTLEWDRLREADLIVEAVFEDIEVKRQVMEKLDALAKPGAILATNTSYLDVATIAEFTRRPQDVLGMHFFSPANVMKLLENVRAPKTAPDVLATAMKLGRAIGKVAVLVGGSDGFVGNRMLAQRTREAFFLLEEGALPQQVDRALVDFGFPMGPFAVGDLAGLDIGWRNRKARAHLRQAGVRDCNLLDKVCEAGRLGQKTGAGWYRYDSQGEGGRVPQPDPFIEQLIVEHSRAEGIERRAISDQEIVERCLYTMINEGARILAEGVAARPVDIDMVWLHGYGFPAWRGGPMFYADQVGLTKVLDSILGFRERFGPDFWTPAPRLEALARAGKAFYSTE